jgi:hypothetical protein
MINLRSTHRITAAAADSEHADPVFIHERMIT